MDYLRGFKIFRDDPEWQSKLLVGVVLGAVAVYIPLLGLVGTVILYGWGTLLLRQAVQTQPIPMPPLRFDIDQWVKLLSVGIKPFLVALIWAIPVSFVLFVVIGFGYFGAFLVAMGHAGSGGGAVGPLASLCIGVGWLIAIPIGVVLGVPAVVAGMRTALTDDFSQGLQLSPVIDFCRANLRELALGLLLIVLIMAVIGGVTCGIGAAVLALPAAAAYALLLAQVYAKWLQAGGAPLPVAPYDLGAVGGGFGGGPGGGGQLPPQGGGPYNQPPQQGGGWGPPPPQGGPQGGPPQGGPPPQAS